MSFNTPRSQIEIYVHYYHCPEKPTEVVIMFRLVDMGDYFGVIDEKNCELNMNIKFPKTCKKSYMLQELEKTMTISNMKTALNLGVNHIEFDTLEIEPYYRVPSD